MDFLVVAGRLVGKLVAGEVENFKALVVVLLIQILQALVLGREAAAGGGVDNQNNLSLESGEVEVLPFSCFYFVIVK